MELIREIEAERAQALADGPQDKAVHAISALSRIRGVGETSQPCSAARCSTAASTTAARSPAMSASRRCRKAFHFICSRWGLAPKIDGAVESLGLG